MEGASQRNNVLSAATSQETSTGNNLVIHHGDNPESSRRQCMRIQPADYGTVSNPIAIDDEDEPDSSSIRRHPATGQYSGHEHQNEPSEAEAEANPNENENNADGAATQNAPLLGHQILEEVIIRESEIIPLENLPELGVTIDDIESMALDRAEQLLIESIALDRAEQLLDDLIEAFTQGRIDLEHFMNGVLVLRACLILQGMMEFPEPNMEVRIGLTQEEIEARMEHSINHVSNDVSAEDVATCCICLDDFANNDQLGKLDCAHEFHYNCIQNWLIRKNECPICKKMALA